MLVGAADGGVDRHEPLDIPGRINPGLGGSEHPLERAVQGPPAEPGISRYRLYALIAVSVPAAALVGRRLLRRRQQN
ncbi:hypothetical protein [Streptomyces flaveolus]|uniref:hypothetical protein n=1 Tax=Streptomyces flaveolus TaxID=67297 RepID=UPI00370142A9